MTSEELEEKAYNLLNEFKRVTPFLVMRKFHLNGDMANKICEKIWLRQHKEARKMARELQM